MAITTEEVKKLASLSRIKLTEEEERGLAGEIDSILGYVAEINKLDLDNAPSSEGGRVNVLREDADANVSGAYTEKLLALSPDRENDYIKVKKIL